MQFKVKKLENGDSQVMSRLGNGKWEPQGLPALHRGVVAQVLAQSVSRAVNAMDLGTVVVTVKGGPRYA